MKTKRIGYKATYNFKCQELTYEIGKTYEIDNIKMCNYGFHYCPNIKDVLEYYNVIKDIKILEIEDIGTERVQKEDKVCTNKIRVLREVPIKEHKLFKVDKNGNIIKWKENTIIYNYKYNDNNQVIYAKYGNVTEQNEYDKNGNLIHQTWADDDIKNEIQYKYSHNNLIYREHKRYILTSIDSYKIEKYKQWFKYDKNGNLIYEKNSNGRKKWYKYDKNNNLSIEKDSYRNEIWYEYDKNGNLIHVKDSNRGEKWYEYDDKGNLIHTKNFNDYEKWYKYDDKGNLIHEKDSNGYELWNEYDDKGNLIHEKNSYGNEKWYEYDDKGDLIYFNNKKTCYRVKKL